ncbi:MAG: hypothetical protein M0Z84_08415 [Gammaproteobacteria bacterium]|nr:hypothetical protein [Gammaproteobacteria bacterium]
MTDLMFLVSRPDAGPTLAALMRACRRRGVSWACFFTNAGVRVLLDRGVVGQLGCASRAVACEYSWERHMGHSQCPVELGSQTGNSALAAETAKIISL